MEHVGAARSGSLVTDVQEALGRISVERLAMLLGTDKRMVVAWQRGTRPSGAVERIMVGLLEASERHPELVRELAQRAAPMGGLSYLLVLLFDLAEPLDR